MTIKQRLLAELYGGDYMEYMRLDDLLNLFEEGEFKSAETIYNRLDAADRALDKLVRDGYLNDYGSSYRITSEGLLFRGAGGYTKSLLLSKRAAIGFWISIISFLIACSSFAISILK